MKKTVWKFTMESIVHSIWKEYWELQWRMKNYNISLLMPEYTVLHDSSTRRDLYVSAPLRFVIVKKQHMSCFLPFGFKSVIIPVINPSGFYSTFFGAYFEYPILLRFDRGSWSELRYFNFERSLKLWWRRALDFDRSQILVTSRGFQGFSRMFLSFEILKLRYFVCFTIFSIRPNMNHC